MDLIEQDVKFPYDSIVNRFRKLLLDRLQQLETFKESPHEFFVKNLLWFSDIVYQAKWWEQVKNLPKLEEKTPLCSIIILCHNNLALTMQCLDALKENTEDIDCEIIVVDNASTDNTYEYLISIPWIKLIRNDENLPFAKANNEIAKIARGDYLLFLNNDTIPQKDWLTEMLKLYESKSDIGIVGSKLLYPNTNKIQHAGVALSPNLTPLILYMKHNADAPEVNKVREFNAVIGACLLIKKQLFFDVQMFDENYINHREDTDLCLKVKEKGFKIYYCPTSVLYHYSRTTETCHEDEHNLTYFINKWKNKIKPDAKEISREDGYELICNKGRYSLKPIEKLQAFENLPEEPVKESNPVKELTNITSEIGGSQPRFDETGVKPLSGEVELSPIIEAVIENTKKSLLVVTRYHRLKKGWSITLDKIYKTNILQQDFEIHHLAWHAKKDEFIDGIHVYAEPELSELNRLEEAIILSKPDVILLHADPHFFPCYYNTLKAWQGPILGWFPVDGEGVGNTLTQALKLTLQSLQNEFKWAQ